jgi:putative peptidoglycan lipid II flippase
VLEELGGALMSDHQLLRASSVMAVGTIASRVTGLIRNLLLVALLGTAILGDTYNVANTMPNILYNLLIGGALTAVFVPQIVRSLRDSDQGAAFISRLFTVTVTFLLLLTALGIALAPIIVNLYAPEFSNRPEFDITVSFMRYCLPQIFFLGLFALLGQIANAKGKFGPMMWAPVINNLIAILLFSWFLVNRQDLSLGNISQTDITWLGLGTTAGYLAQALILLPVVIKSGVKLTLRFDWHNSQIIKSFRLASWSFLYAMISQVSYLVTVSIATSAAVKTQISGDSTGVGFTPYSNAYLILILPHSIITVSVVTALLPRLSNYVLDKKHEELTSSLTKAIRLIGIFTVPAALLFLAFGQLVANTLYFGISDNDANYLGLTLSAFAIGLIPVSINLVLLRGLNAFENLKSQVIGNLIMNLISVVLSYLIAVWLEPKWVTVGLAAIFTLHYFIGAGISFYLIKRHQIRLPLVSIILYYLRLIAIFALVITPIWLFRGAIPGGNLISLLLITSVSAIFYLLIAKLLKISEVSDLLKVIWSRKV